MSTDQGDPANNPDWLLLIPTEFERGFIADSISKIPGAIVEICGFGPVVPAARTVQLIEQHRPQRVLLLGIAGKYDSRLEIGQACRFSQVSCYGVGLGSGATFQTAEEMDWLQWDSEDPQRVIGDTIPLSEMTTTVEQTHPQLLTVCSAAGNQADVAHRQCRFPDAVAEDMEGFAVASACRLCGVPISIVRGISNQAGDRDKQNWQIREAMLSVSEICQRVTGYEL